MEASSRGDRQHSLIIYDVWVSRPAKALQEGVISSTGPASYNIELMVGRWMAPLSVHVCAWWLSVCVCVQGGVCRERGIQVGDTVHFDWHIPCSDSRGNGNDASHRGEVCFKA